MARRVHEADPPLDRVTISDVARRAGVSIGTASHVLTGRHFVSPERERRVRQVVQDLGYRPNRVARSLTLQRTNTIAMIIPDVANPFFGELMRGVEDVARHAGFCVVFGNSDNDPIEETRYLTEFAERRVDGLIAAVASRDGGSLANLPRDLPVVAVDRVPEPWSFDAVIADNNRGMRAAVDHLRELGHERIAYVGGDTRLSTGRERRDGFLSAMEHHGLRSTWIGEGSFSLDNGREQAARLLARARRTWPTAIVAANDLIALGVLAAARDASVAVPDEVSVVGFDDIVYATLPTPALTTIHQPVREMGSVAAALLFTRMDGTGGPIELRVLQPLLVVRESTRAPAPRVA